MDVIKSYYPLPPDYEELTKEGKKRARLSLASNHSTPEKFVLAWDFFRRYYLKSMPPGFFYKTHCESPPFHYQAIYDMARYHMNILGAPRGFSKSVIIGIEIPLLLCCTRPSFEISIGTSTWELLKDKFEMIMYQLTNNPRILEDYGCLKPNRGGGRWNTHFLSLSNRVHVRGFSVDGKKRGGRADLLLLDDPEFDTRNEQVGAKMRRDFETLVFKQMIPMMHPQASVFWIGTIIDRRSFIYHAFYGEDSRFSHWNRRILAACKIEGTEFNSLLWPERFDVSFLQQKRLEMGPAPFAAEFLNAPASDEDRIFRIYPDRHTYQVVGDQHSKDIFLSSDATIISMQVREKGSEETDYKGLTRITLPFVAWVKTLYRVSFIDYARTTGTHSDYSCVMTLGFDRQDIMYVLDMWLGKVSNATLEDITMKQGYRWRSQVLAPEAISIQKEMAEQLGRRVDRDKIYNDWYPKVFHVRYPSNTPKAQRIAGLEWRFHRNRIKLPEKAPPYDNKMWQELRNQIADFTLSLELLPKDDAIDTLAMHQYLGRKRGTQKEREPEVKTTRSMLLEGQREVPKWDVPLISGMNMEDIDEEVLDALRIKDYNNQKTRQKRSSRYDGRRSSYVGTRL